MNKKPEAMVHVCPAQHVTGTIAFAHGVAEIEAIGNVNVALVPVGGGGGLNAAKAAEVVSLLEPNIVVPMHYHTPAVKVPLDKLDKFLKELGLHEVETLPALKVTRSGMPDETKVVVLEYQREQA